eukprot:12902779-Prorocentrum_lima.AAC.1
MSPRNNRRGENGHCVADGSGKIGSTAHATFQFLRERRSMVGMYENVQQVSQPQHLQWLVTIANAA